MSALADLILEREKLTKHRTWMKAVLRRIWDNVATSYSEESASEELAKTEQELKSVREALKVNHGL